MQNLAAQLLRHHNYRRIPLQVILPGRKRKKLKQYPLDRRGDAPVRAYGGREQFPITGQIVPSFINYPFVIDNPIHGQSVIPSAVITTSKNRRGCDDAESKGATQSPKGVGSTRFGTVAALTNAHK